MVGGLLYGAMHRPVSPILLLLGMSALTIPMGFAHGHLDAGLLSLLPGLLCAPVLSAASEKVAELVDEGRRGEAMGWYGSALTGGVALGAPLAGLFIDAHRPVRPASSAVGWPAWPSASWDWPCNGPARRLAARLNAVGAIAPTRARARAVRT